MTPEETLRRIKKLLEDTPRPENWVELADNIMNNANLSPGALVPVSTVTVGSLVRTINDLHKIICRMQEALDNQKEQLKDKEKER